jgi:hypothetical protein
VKWGNNKFIINGYTNTSIRTSPDGITWSSVTSSNFVALNGPINWNNNHWLMGQTSSTKSLLYSTDNGVTWNVCNITSSNVVYGIAFALPAPIVIYPCFLQGSKILRLDTETDIESYVPVETLRPGDLIRTSQNGYKAIFHIGKKILPNPSDDPDERNRLYRFSKSKIPGMREDLCITGEHCTLHDNLSTSLEEKVRKHMGDIYITEYQYRVPACVDERAEPYTDKDAVTIWHFALENHNVYYNYGVYANGLLVESCSIQYLTELSNMELIE